MLLSKTTVVLFCALSLAACGFQPLYGLGGSSNVITGLSSIQVAPANDRIGQLLTNELKRLLNPLNNPSRPSYRLLIKVTESTRSLAVKKTALATRTNLNARVTYRLKSIGSGQVITSGRNRIDVSYNIYSAEYATVAAEKDARNRALKELAQDIRLQLGAFFKNNPQILSSK